LPAKIFLAGWIDKPRSSAPTPSHKSLGIDEFVKWLGMLASCRKKGPSRSDDDGTEMQSGIAKKIELIDDQPSLAT
jgi:hypothetical protein